MNISRGIALSLIISSVLIILLFVLALSAFSFSPSGKTPEWVYRSSGIVNSLVITEDQNYVVAGSGETLNSGSIMLFDANNGNLVWSFPADRVIDTLAVSGNGSSIVAGGYQLSSGPDQIYENGAVYFLNSNGKLLSQHRSQSCLRCCNVS